LNKIYWFTEYFLKLNKLEFSFYSFKRNNNKYLSKEVEGK